MDTYSEDFSESSKTSNDNSAYLRASHRQTDASHSQRSDTNSPIRTNYRQSDPNDYSIPTSPIANENRSSMELRSNHNQSPIPEKRTISHEDEKRVSTHSQQISEPEIHTQPLDNNNQAAPSSNAAVHRSRHVISSRPRRFAVDINISFGHGNNNNRSSVVRTVNARPTSSQEFTPTSRATIDNGHVIDINVHLPSRTTQITTDGILHTSS